MKALRESAEKVRQVSNEMWSVHPHQQSFNRHMLCTTSSKCAIDFARNHTFTGKINLHFPFPSAYDIQCVLFAYSSAFLQVLNTYHMSQQSITEVLEQVSQLFADHADLLMEFTYFLPDTVQDQVRLYIVPMPYVHVCSSH